MLINQFIGKVHLYENSVQNCVIGAIRLQTLLDVLQICNHWNFGCQRG